MPVNLSVIDLSEVGEGVSVFDDIETNVVRSVDVCFEIVRLDKLGSGVAVCISDDFSVVLYCLLDIFVAGRVFRFFV